MRKKQIAIIGMGYASLSFAAVLSNCGYRVYVFDIDETKIELLNKGKAFCSEPGLDKLVSSGFRKGFLKGFVDYENFLPKADIIFSCVDLTSVFDIAKIVASLAKDGVVYVQKSIVPVGTGREIMNIVADENPKLNFSYVSNPHFVSDALVMDRVVLGSDDPKAIDYVFGLYKSIEEYFRSIKLKGIFREVKTTLETAELIQSTSNALLSLNLSFVNSIAQLCDKVGADVNEVMDAVGMEVRAGSFFSNDVSSLLAVAKKHGVDLPLMEASVKTNEKMTGYILKKVRERLGDLRGKRVGLLGLTQDLAELFVKEECFVCAYDPRNMEDAKAKLSEKVIFVDSVEDAVSGCDFVCVATKLPEFLNFDFLSLKGKVKKKLIVDCQNRLDKEKLKKEGFEYIGVGRG